MAEKTADETATNRAIGGKIGKIELRQVPRLTIDWTLDALQNRPAQFSGRASRAEYWCFTLAVLVLSVAVSVISAALAYTPISVSVLTAISIAASVILCLPVLPVGARRLHDTNRSGWWLLLWLVPIAGWAALIYFTLLEGGEGENRYGKPARKTPYETQNNRL
ncbi:hypothetical protein FACS189487_02870 [Campylobacterota bacterium]|nr:hypothetical protein FACS189487_02870 [Campylobacterota bacterium]